MRHPLIYHPFLFGLYPIVALISENIDQVRLSEAWRSLSITLGVTLLLGLLYKTIARSWEKAGLLCTLSLILFFSYGHVYRLLEGKSLVGVPIGRADLLAALWVFIYFNLAWLIVRILKRTTKITNFLNLVTLLALVVPSYRIIVYSTKTFEEAHSIALLHEHELTLPRSSAPLKPPDIYYIIVDGYGQAGILERYYGFDNADFLDFLREKGFFIANLSHSNYAQTSLSLASTLNFEYLEPLTTILGSASSSRDPLLEMIRHSQVREIVQRYDYQFVAFASGYSVTEIDDADVYFDAAEKINAFETMLVTNSAAVLAFDRLTPIWYRERLIYILDTLAAMPSIESPKFVFAHITMPHPPFVFGPNGEALPPRSFREGNYYGGPIEEYLSGYRGQLIFLNHHLERIITNILEDSQNNPIIILQGDHGPGAYLNWDSIELTCLEERLSILNAYYIPGDNEKGFYDSITPVNTFRLILNMYFNTDLELLDDRSYFSLWNTPYNLIEVTDRLQPCKAISSH